MVAGIDGNEAGVTAGETAAAGAGIHTLGIRGRTLERSDEGEMDILDVLNVCRLSQFMIVFRCTPVSDLFRFVAFCLWTLYFSYFVWDLLVTMMQLLCNADAKIYGGGGVNVMIIVAALFGFSDLSRVSYTVKYVFGIWVSGACTRGNGVGLDSIRPGFNLRVPRWQGLTGYSCSRVFLVVLLLKK